MLFFIYALSSLDIKISVVPLCRILVAAQDRNSKLFALLS